jgi:hypothetical protein
MDAPMVLVLAVGAGVIGGVMGMSQPSVRSALPGWVWPLYWTAMVIVLVVAAVAWWLGWN